VLNVWGGKITTFRSLAEQAVDHLCPHLSCGRGGWTREARLPGGDLSRLQAEPGCAGDPLAGFQAALRRRYRQLPEALLDRYALAYGSRCLDFLGEAKSAEDLGLQVVEDLYEAELGYLADREWARCAEDVLWRRTKLGLRLGQGAGGRIQQWLDERLQRQGETR
jgi:glycerol-3-phosphate dehydrogenase